MAMHGLLGHHGLVGSSGRPHYCRQTQRRVAHAGLSRSRATTSILPSSRHPSIAPREAAPSSRPNLQAFDEAKHSLHMPAASGVEVDILRRQVHDLSSLVREQQIMLTKQQEAMERQEGVLRQQEAAIEQLRNSVTQQQPVLPLLRSGWNTSIRPFDAQRAASYGDRRLAGMYDARFHSTRR
jgi:hypothetical protein